MLNVPEKIYKMRIQRGLNEKQFAVVTKLEKSTISSWQNKGNIPTVASLEMVCNAFGITLSQFFSENGEILNLTQEQKFILDKYEKLSDIDKEKTRIFIRGMLTK